MFDIGWSEMVFVGIVAILVIGPKDLPRAIASIGKYIRKARSLARDFQSGIDDLARDADLDDLKKTVTGDGDFNLKKQIEDAVDPDGDFSTMFDDVKPDIVDKDDTSSDTSNTEDTAGETPSAPDEENTIGASVEAPSEEPSATKAS